jgi:ABC-type polar amino acid transport system ATPase subunit
MIVAHSETGQMAVCCQNLPLGALSSRSAPSVLVGALFKKFCLFGHAEIQENAIRELRAIKESAFQKAFQQWKKRWEQCIASRGDYFEGDSA